MALYVKCEIQRKLLKILSLFVNLGQNIWFLYHDNNTQTKNIFFFYSYLKIFIYLYRAEKEKMYSGLYQKFSFKNNSNKKAWLKNYWVKNPL